MPELLEAFEHRSELLLQSGNRSTIAALVEFALQLATSVSDTQGWAVRRVERAASWSAKRAAAVIAARWFQLGRRRSGKLERGQLIVGEKILGAGRAAMPARPAHGTRPNALCARFDFANPSRQFIPKHAQPPSKLRLSSACDTGARLLGEPPTHVAKFIGTRAGPK